MPLVRISLLAGKPEAHKRKVSDAVHRALVETISIPAQDRFQIITEHAKTDFIFDPQYLNISRTDDLVIIQITMSAGRTLEVRKALYRRMAESAPSGSRLAQGRCLHQSGGNGKRELVIRQRRSAVRDMIRANRRSDFQISVDQRLDFQST